MGKSNRGHKEYSREQRLIHENQKLKRENATLRKQLSKIDLDRYSEIRDIVEEHRLNEEKEEIVKNAKRDAERWRCWSCGNGSLVIISYPKAGSEWYFRKCSNPSCDHRTRSQPISNKR